MEFSRRKHNRQFARLKIDVNRLVFNHHWMFSTEDRLARKTQFFYEAYMNTMESIMKHIHKYLNCYEIEQFSSELSEQRYSFPAFY